MKQFIVGIVLVVLASACRDKIYQKYMANVPVYTDYETFRETGGFEASRAIEQKGNIYFKDDYLFIVEPDKGIHFIDNSNPTIPGQAGFLRVWGATGMAIRGNYLYVNSFIDLLVYDISSFSHPTEVYRLEDVFPGALPFSNKNYPYEMIDKTKGVVTSWQVKEIKEDITNGQPTWKNCVGCQWSNVAMNESLSDVSNSSGGNVGIAGSISLFTIVNDYLYVMENGSVLHPIEISNPSIPVAYDGVNAWGNVETLFPYQDYIFMGTPSGMIVYDTSDPRSPQYVSSLSHARGCDPVVVQSDYAYVTVRSGGQCGGDINQLDVIDVSNITNPVLKASFPMKNPHGLGIDGTSLFICDGDAGLKVFDASNPLECGDHLIDKFKNIQATDVIPFGAVAMVIGDDGIYQYDYSSPGDMVLISSIKF